MASPAIAPNRRTGPRTPEGKAVSSLNATTHGLSSSRVVLPHEDQLAFDQLLVSLETDLNATGSHEIFLAHQMAECQWRLNRLRRIETALMDQLLLSAEPGSEPEDQMAKAMIERGGDPLDKIERYAANTERSYYRARRELTTYRKQQNELDLQARQLADHEHYLMRRAQTEARIFPPKNPAVTVPEPPAPPPPHYNVRFVDPETHEAPEKSSKSNSEPSAAPFQAKIIGDPHTHCRSSEAHSNRVSSNLHESSPSHGH